MKKILLTLAIAVSFTSLVNAQNFVTSFGVQLGWNLPTRVNTVVYHDYYGYDVVHATRVSRFGVGYFDLILQRGDIFVEVSVRNDGWVDRRVVRYDYPLANHVCGSVCGYHSTYYTTYYNSCSGHSHHGHNHVVYVNNRRPHHVHGNNHPGKGHAYGHNKNHKNNNYKHDSRRDSESYTRRDRNYDPDRNSRVSRTTYSQSSNSRSNGNTNRSTNGRSRRSAD